ncbi:MAG: hypothetical protein ABSB01_10555 [Streptosporangiaceae bacterium]|jgi:hypothetical protein
MQRKLRFARAPGLDGNPLRRGIDRLQTAVTLGLCALFLISAPLLATAAWRWTHQASLAQQRAEQGWHQVSAVTLQSTPPADQYASQWQDTAVLASWAAPSGIKRVGEILVPAPLAAGQRVRIWVNGSGWQTGPPLSPSQLTTRAIGVAALAPILLAGALLSIGWLARWLLNRRKLADWEAAWTLVEPQWTKQR